MKVAWVLAVVIAVFSGLYAAASSPLVAGENSATSFLHVVIIGGTGDLAVKYLWVACFRLAFEAFTLRRERVYFVAAARESQEQGNAWLRRFFSRSWVERVCSRDNKTEEGCASFYTDHFLPNIQYAHLGAEEDYALLSTSMRDGGQGREIGRLVYLAVPPSVFLQAASAVSTHLRPQSQGSFFRVVVEKPFGHDLKSAHALADGLRQVLTSDEMLLIDHYAGKAGVRVIDPLVRLNEAVLGPIWNGDFIKSVTISMTETETCEHRLDYFDRSGIIRDVIANHLHLLLGVVIGAAIPQCLNAASATERACEREFQAFVRSLYMVKPVVMGQYVGYNRNSSSRTPTAASVELVSSHSTWAKTRFQLTAAKATAHRKAEVSIAFSTGIGEEGVDECALRIVIQDGQHTAGERIEWSCPSRGQLAAPPGWIRSTYDPNTLIPEARYEMKPWHLGDPISAYDVLLRDAAVGQARGFMKVEDVLAAWEVWTPIVNAADASGFESMIRYAIGAQSWMQPASLSCWPSPLLPTQHQGEVCLITQSC